MQMLTPGQLARQRFWSNFRFQVRAWRLAVDWTVALYLVVPGLLFAGYEYSTWWTSAPAWLGVIPYSYVRVLLFIIVVSGGLRFYVEEADQLFLVQRTLWYRKLMAAGAAYSIGVHLLGLLLVLMLLYPLLKLGYGLPGTEIVLLVAAAFGFRMWVMVAKQRLDLVGAGWWRKQLLRVLMLSAAGTLFTIAWWVLQQGLWAGLALVLLVWLPVYRLVGWRLSWRGSFFQDVRRERGMKLRIVAMMLSRAGLSTPKKAATERKRFVIFGRSGRVFPRKWSQKEVLAESVIKAAFRDSDKLQFMLIALAAYTVALVVSPSGSIRWIVFGSVSVLQLLMARGYVKEIFAERFIRMFAWRDLAKLESANLAGAGISMPGCIWVAMLTGVMEQGLLWGLLMVPVGAGIAWLGSQVAGISGV